jgi:hypothetical protein
MMAMAVSSIVRTHSFIKSSFSACKKGEVSISHT